MAFVVSRVFFPPMMRVVSLLAAVLFAGCATSHSVHVAPEVRDRIEADSTVVAPEAAETFRVLLVGDAGSADAGDPLLALLRHHAENAGPNSATVFLGDNIYPDGLPPADHPGRARAEAHLRAQLDAVAGAPGRAFMVPGNHDWNDSEPGGLARLQEQEALVESVLGEGSFLPSNGFPGPIEVELADGLTMLAIDTEWWLGVHARGEGEDDEADASIGTDEDFLIELVEAVEDANDDHVLVVGHHPILSEGVHAGAVPLRNHLFPLLAAHPKAYVPLPFVGSLVVAMKTFLGEDRQDLGHPRYQALADALKPIFASHESLIYAAGHEHNLQYLEQLNGRGVVRQLVSGAGSEGDPVYAGAAQFAAGQRGFTVLRYFDDGSATLHAVVPDGTPDGRAIARLPILDARQSGLDPIAAPDAPRQPDSLAVAASGRYGDPGVVQRFLVGEGYRQTWSTPVRAPVLDFDARGLTVTRYGGDRQTQSFHLKDAEGRLYRLRSIDKDPPNPFGLGLTYGVGLDWGQDATSGLYPFGALVAARLSDAAGLYHTNPQLVVIPDDPRLGRARERVGGTLMWFEDHPDESGEGRPHFGEAPNLVGAGKLRRELDADADHRVDARFYLRARLFDLVLGDWDRHTDQWRWAAFEPGELDPSLSGDAATKGKVYRAVARDRDYALNDRDGALFRLAQPHMPKIQGLRDRYVNVAGLTQNARGQDLRLLAPLDADDWRREAESLRASITDEAIDAALRTLPAEVYARDAPPLRRALRARRDRLVEAALDFYDVLDNTVEVVGTQDKDAFELEWLADGGLRLTVRQRAKDGDGLVLWTRVIDPDETDEVRIWARGDDDLVTIRGERRSGIDVRILPGAGEDEIRDETDGAGLAVYEGSGDDTGTIQLGERARLDRNNRIPESAYGYVPQASFPALPIAVVGYNADDGFRLGGGLELAYAGFGHDPYARRHRVQASVATTTGGVAASYDGHYIDAIGRQDLGLRARAQTPLAAQNFFGYGDGPLVEGAPSSFYRVRLAEALVEPYAERTLPRGVYGWVGPSFGYARPDVDSTRVLATVDLPERDLAAQTLLGLATGLRVDAVDAPDRPTRGARMAVWGRARQGLLRDGHRYARLGSALTLYLTPPRAGWLTLALRGGGEHIVGTFPFYDAATVGGARSLRGYRQDRFAGRTAAWATAEPRVVLSQFRFPIVQYAEAGVLGFADVGRVWADEQATDWHLGAGGGVWLSLPGVTALTLTYDASPERTGVALRMGFAL